MSKLNLVMNTFSGRYLGKRSNKNIGHENINFFMPSNTDGFYLLWFNCDGVFPVQYSTHDGEINLLMVTNFANEKDKFRVLAFAKNCHLIPGVTIPSQKPESKNARHTAFLSKFGSAQYGHETLENIFLDNTYQGNPDGGNTLATFYTSPDNISVPSNPNHTIQIRDVDGADIKQNMANEKMRMYIKDNDSFDALIKSINWIPFDRKQNILPGFNPNSNDFKENETFFTATRNEKDELSLSNIIAYCLSNSSELFRNFVNILVGANYNGNAEYNIQREDKHVDLTIMLNDRTIIIENKINSTIVETGYETKEALIEKILRAFKDYKPSDKIPKRQNKLVEYNEKLALYNEIKSKINDFVDAYDGPFCQLSKYYIQSRVDAFLKDRENIPINYFFLVPNYTKNKFNTDKNNYLIGKPYSNNYKMITYEDLYNIFSEVQNFPYRDDVLKEFELLKSDVDNADQNRQIYIFLKKAGL